MPQPKRIFLKAVLLPLSLLAMAAAIFRRKSDAWEYERIEEEVAVEPLASAPPPHVADRRSATHSRSRFRPCSSPEPPLPQAPATRW